MCSISRQGLWAGGVDLAAGQGAGRAAHPWGYGRELSVAKRGAGRGSLSLAARLVVATQFGGGALAVFLARGDARIDGSQHALRDDQLDVRLLRVRADGDARHADCWETGEA